jgi:protein TonB
VEIVEDDKEEDDISLDQNEDTVIVQDVWEEPEIEIDAIADIVEQKAEYPGGQSALLSWLNKNIEYPEIAAESNIQGRVFVQFVVEKNGTISDVKTIGKVPHKALGKEAVKKVKRIPGKWAPGKNNGKAVRSYFKLPVMFRLK